MTRDVVAYSQDIYQERRMSNGVEASVCVPGGASVCVAGEVTFWRGGHVGVEEAGGEVPYFINKVHGRNKGEYIAGEYSLAVLVELRHMTPPLLLLLCTFISSSSYV